MLYRNKSSYNELIFQNKIACCYVIEKNSFELTHIYSKIKKENIRPAVWWSRELNENIVHAERGDIIFVIEKDIYRTTDGRLVPVWYVIYGEKFGWMFITEIEDFEPIQ
jgi:hypothetical protein